MSPVAGIVHELLQRIAGALLLRPIYHQKIKPEEGGDLAMIAASNRNTGVIGLIAQVPG